jgi:DNA polymerase elongation subunit (family B)
MVRTKINKSKNESITHNIATQISSAIAAYGRIHIHNIKMDILSKGGKIYYSDTDSIITDIPMETSTKLGGLKLENKIKKG